VLLKAGNLLTITPRKVAGTAALIATDFAGLAREVKPGSRVLLSDGRIELKVRSTRGDDVECEVLNGGMLGEQQGINLPGAAVAIPALTAKDKRDLEFGLKHGVDVVALSFVRSADDLRMAKSLMREFGKSVPIVAKLEKPQAIERLEEILEVTSGVMIARGDLGVELPPEDVPLAQKRIIRAARQLGCPVVVATQMLESMITAPAPTRAEASDVATAVFDGADAVMLSAETAAGQYPIEAVNIMDRIIARVEADPGWRSTIDSARPEPEKSVADAIAAAARQVAHTIAAPAICSFTSSGSTARRAARERPEPPILGLTASEQTARRLAVVWGVHAIVTADVHSMTETVTRASRLALTEGFAQRGEDIVVIAGLPFGQPGTTNALRVARVK
jgi:pyruvate kinase